MSDRLFTDDELHDLSSSYMDLALAALDRGDIDTARDLCRKQEQTKYAIHDLYLHWTTALMSYVHEHFGEDAAARAVRDTVDRYNVPLTSLRRSLIEKRGFRAWFQWFADNILRQHCMTPGLKIEEDDEKFVIHFRPCGSGGRLIEMGAFDGPFGYARIRKPGPHTWGEPDVPIYCTHCAYLEMLPQRLEGPGAQLYIVASRMKKPGEPCVLHVYKDPDRIPDACYERIGMRRDPSDLPRS
ncbi:MAG: hypothetical protein IT495_12775 [Gammaproteobacteria bacterium]|nr:hypothetical protein [Gammaproteobacteria bacterium]